jgi:isocitrate dehydrogenase
MTQLKPFAFINGDQTAGNVARMVARTVFRDYPMIAVDCSVCSRVFSNDACITDATKTLRKCGAGVKISTATDDANILKHGLGSANIHMRAQMGVVGILRLIEHPQGYEKPCAIFRYGSGGFYHEQTCEVVAEGGTEFAVVTSKINLSNLKLFAQYAIKISREYGLKIHVSSKWTISHSERLFVDRICAVLDVEDVDYYRDLTDVGLAKVATDRVGGWLWLFDNPNGDSASDIVDWTDGSRSMTSTLYCERGIKYEEMPGGTAPDKEGTNLRGENFFNPVGIIGCFTRAILAVNPHLSLEMGNIHQKVDEYLEDTPAANWSTVALIEAVAGIDVPA